jgi:surface polysaccharide O-acyltransferase-like enzyme
MLSHLQTLEGFGPAGVFGYFLVGNATAWFVFLSGYLFHYIESGNFHYLEYMSKKWKFVILPYLILSVPAIIAGIWFFRPEALGVSKSAYVIWALIVGGSVIGPMWFIPMITIFFLISPMLHRLTKGRWIYPVGLIALAFGMFSSRPLNGTNPLLSFFHFLGFYLLGLAFAKNASLMDKMTASTRWALIIAGVVGFLISALFFGGSSNEPLGFFAGLGKFNMLQFGKFALLIAVFFLFEQVFNRPNRAFGYFAKISFGLFFIHGFHFVFFSKLKQLVPDWSAFTIFAGELIFVVVAPVATVYIIKRLLGKNSRYVIGC